MDTSPAKAITLITRLVRGGAQKIALASAADLRRRGWDARLWCGAETGAEGSLHAEAAAFGVPLRIFPHLVRRLDPYEDARALRSLAHALQEERPRWVHTHSSKAGILGREASRMAGCPGVIHTVHGWGFTSQTPPPLRAFYIGLERRAARHTTRMLFVSRSDLEEGVRLGILDRAQGTWIPPGIDLSPFADAAALRTQRARKRQELGIPQQALLGGFLGRLAPQKDPGMVLTVAHALAAERSGLRWLVVGDGPLAPRLRARERTDPALRGRILWAGLQEDPVPWLAAMDFLLLPSLWEGAPLTILEAMAAGLPVIASDLEGVRPLFREAAGFLAHPGKAEEFIALVRGWTAEPAGLRAQGRAGREQALAEFGIERMHSRILEVYEDAAGSG